jgi:hypothetical protein
MTDFSLLVNLDVAMLLPKIRRKMAVRSPEGVQVDKSLSLELPKERYFAHGGATAVGVHLVDVRLVKGGRVRGVNQGRSIVATTLLNPDAIFP